MTARITIFHTSDTHNKLNSGYARLLHDLKAANPGSLMLDSGDAIWAGNIFWRPRGEPVLDLMNDVPYDAMCMGNREFHFLDIGMTTKTSRARFPILSANLRTPHSALRTPHSALRIPHSTLRITVFGLTVPCITERMLVKRVSDYYFEQPIAAAADLVPRLRPDCDLLIALTHIGIRHDRGLAQSVAGIDLILGGHTHTVTREPERVGDTFILHHGFHAHYAGKVVVDREQDGIRVTNELIPLAKA